MTDRDTLPASEPIPSHWQATLAAVLGLAATAAALAGWL